MGGFAVRVEYKSVAMTDPAVLTFIAIPVLLVAALAIGVAYSARRLGEPPGARLRVVSLTIAAAAAWMASTWAAAQSGALLDFERTPPPFALLLAGIVILAIRIALTRFGRRLAIAVPLWALIGVQAFRLPLELAMHALYERGVMPVQMSYSGRNFDIVTGITAIAVALIVRRSQAEGVALSPGMRRLVAAWNTIGLALVLNVVIIGVLSTPRLLYFGVDHVNTFVMRTPFVWLPAVMVLAALSGHLLIFRALLDTGRRPH